MPDNFDVHLPIDGQIINAPVYNPGPSPLNAVLNTVSQGLQQFQQDSETRARENDKKKKEAIEQREEDARGFIFDSALKVNAELGGTNSLDPFIGLVQGPQPFTMPATPASDSLDPATAIIEGAIQSGTVAPARMNELHHTVQAQTDEITNIETSISQGSMPRSARDAAIDRMLLETRNLFPDVDTDVIVSMMEKMGLKNTMFYEIQRTFNDRKAIDESRAASVSQAHDRGMEVLGTAAANMTQEQIIASGMQSIQVEQETAAIKARLDIAKAQGELSDAEIARNERQAAQQIQTITIQSAMDTFAPLVNNAQKLIDVMGQNVGSNPAAEEQFMEVMGQLKTRLPVLIENYASQVFTATQDPEKADAIRKYLTQTLENTIIKPLESRDADFNALVTRLQTNLGLKVSQAYPFIALTKAMGVDLQLTDTLLEQLNPETRERLANEIAQVVGTDIYSLRQRESAQMQLMEIVEVLNGNSTLSQLNLSPQQLQQRFRVIDRTVNTLTPRINQGDLRQETPWLNGMAEVAVAAGQLNRTSNVTSLGNAIASLTGNGTSVAFNTLMRSGVDPERAQAVGLGTRAAVARSMQALLNKPMQFDNGYAIRYRNGRWETFLDIRPGSRAAALRDSMGGNRTVTVPPEARIMVTSLNAASNFLVRTAEWDEGAPKGTEAELRAWYNEGKPPKSMQQELQRQRTEGQGSVMNALNAFEELLQTGDFSLQVPTRAGGGGLEIDAQGNAVLGQGAQTMAGEARKLGYSPAVVAGILANVQHESAFNPGGPPGDSGTAFGYFQHREDRVENFLEVTGVHPSRATPAQAMQFFDWEMKNPEAAGMTTAEVAAIKGADTAAEAAMLIQRHYERPANVDPARAQTALAFYGALFGQSRGRGTQ